MLAWCGVPKRIVLVVVNVVGILTISHLLVAQNSVDRYRRIKENLQNYSSSSLVSARQNQTVLKWKADSLIEQVPVGDGFEKSYKEIYSQEGDANVITSWKWDANKAAWEKHVLVKTLFDDQEREVWFEIYQYSESKGDWKGVYKDSLEYEGEQIKTYFGYRWDHSAWEWEKDYDCFNDIDLAAGIAVETCKIYRADQWYPHAKNEAWIDEWGRDTVRVEYQASNSLDTLLPKKKFEIQYNLFGKQRNVTESAWFNSINDWRPLFYDTHQYHLSGNPLLTQRHVWWSADSVWKLRRKTAYEYDGQNRETLQIYSYADTTDTWTNTLKYTNEYKEQLHTYARQRWDTLSNDWIIDHKTINTLGEPGVLSYEYFESDPFTFEYGLDEIGTYYYSPAEILTVEHIEETPMMAIYPNPAHESFNLSITPPIGDKLVILDLNGRKVKEIDVDSRGYNIEDLLPGVYYVIVSRLGKTKVEKLIKK